MNNLKSVTEVQGEKIIINQIAMIDLLRDIVIALHSLNSDIDHPCSLKCVIQMKRKAKIKRKRSVKRVHVVIDRRNISIAELIAFAHKLKSKP